MITITDRALDRIREVRETEARAAQVLRLRVLAGGCSGFSYQFGWEEAAGGANDEVSKFDDVTVIVDKISLSLVTATEIDYESGLYGAGFVFKNPHATGGCGCGQSFSA